MRSIDGVKDYFLILVLVREDFGFYPENLGAIYIKYGLWSSIIVHYLWNNAGNIFLKTNDLEEKGIVTILIIIISLVILFGKKRRRGYRLSR